MIIKKAGKRKRRKKRTTSSDRSMIFLLAFFAFMGMITFVAAKYIRQREVTRTVRAQEFYFTSDLLDEKQHSITAMEKDGTASVTFHLMNHADELRYSDVDIAYTVTVDEEGNTQRTEAHIEKPSGTIAAGENHDQEITVSEMYPGKTYTVTAVTNNTYQKTLTGTIKVNEQDMQVHASVADKGPYIEVTVWTTEGVAENLSITYCKGLIPDNTDPLMSQAKTGQTTENITIGTWNANTSHVFRFFKETAGSKYTVAVNETEVTVSAQS